MNKEITIYDPPMCCSSGICGPAVDPALMRMNDAILALQKQGIAVNRYNLRSDFERIKDNQEIMDLIHSKGTKALPITVIGDLVYKTGEYPTYEDLCSQLQIKPLSTASKPITLQVI